VRLEYRTHAHPIGDQFHTTLGNLDSSMNTMPWKEWYNSLIKPSWTPAPDTIGVVWQILYPLIMASFGYVFLLAFQRKIPSKVALPFALNLIVNLSFTPIQFGLRNLPLAALDILMVWVSILWCISAIWNHSRLVAIAQMPYFIWVSIATYLQLYITIMNWGR
jgi:tryptophan-rich sensory protein